MLFANVGLNQIISISTPVLMFIYPLAITLILLSLLEPLIGYHKPIYVWVTILTFIAALFDGLNATPAFISTSSWAHTLLVFAGNVIPFFTIGMGWVVPAIIGFIIGFIQSKLTKA
jgi:LIVCS family branched-chain amino acid:cation transporter